MHASVHGSELATAFHPSHQILMSLSSPASGSGDFSFRSSVASATSDLLSRIWARAYLLCPCHGHAKLARCQAVLRRTAGRVMIDDDPDKWGIWGENKTTEVMEYTCVYAVHIPNAAFFTLTGQIPDV